MGKPVESKIIISMSNLLSWLNINYIWSKAFVPPLKCLPLIQSTLLEKKKNTVEFNNSNFSLLKRGSKSQNKQVTTIPTFSFLKKGALFDYLIELLLPR